MTPRRIGWGLLSTARINDRLIPAIRSEGRSELVAVASRRGLDEARKYAGERSIPKAYGTYEAMLSDPDVDVVYVSLPNSLHAAWSIHALEAGKHVLCEKPLATSAGDVDQMAQAAERHGVVLQEAVMMRFHPQTRELRRLVAEGIIGEVRLIRGVFCFMLERPGDVRFEPALGGGSVWDVGSYPVSFIRTMLAAEPVEVHGWQIPNDRGVDLSFAGQMRFATGTLAQFFSSFQTVPHAEMELIGTLGKIHLDLPYLNKTGVTSTVRIERTRGVRAVGTFSDASPFDESALKFDNIDAYRDEVRAMVDCIADGAPPTVALAESRGNIATLEALCASARQGRPVSL
jgi:predicted dehydrogenase